MHLPDEAPLRGVVQYSWMYPIERRLCTLKHYVRNRPRPKGSIAEAYIVDECLPFCSRYFSDVETRYNWQERHDINIDKGVPGDELSIFKHGVTVLGASKFAYNDAEYDKLVWYVLKNCREVDEYKEFVLTFTLIFFFIFVSWLHF